MIELSLWRGSASSIDLDQLGAAALTRVIEALRDCRYEVSESAGSGEGRLSSQVFDIAPGPAALTVVTDGDRGRSGLSSTGTGSAPRLLAVILIRCCGCGW